LKAFSVDRGSEFLRSITSKARPLSSEDQEAVEWISRQFGGLPLALRQAGAFINHKVCSPSHYKRLYQEIYEKIENYKIPCATGHEKTIADIWQLSTSMLSEDARIILDALSLFDPDSIPAELLEVMDISHPHTEILKDPLRILDAREDLTSQSLVDHDYDSNTFSIHRLLQETTFRKLKKDVTRFRKTIHFSISLIHRLSPDIDLMMIRSPQHWKPMEKVLSHVHSIYDRSKNVITEAEAVILLHLMTKILNYGFETAQANLGDQAFQYIQELVREISQPDQEILALVYFTHGRLCCETSRQQQAIQEVVQSYNHIKNAAAGNPELFKTTLYVRILSNLGITHTAVERFDEAEKYHLRAIEHCKLLKMQKDCSMGNLLQNLANCYLWGGRMQEAKLTLDDARTYPNTAPEAVNYTLGNWMLKSKRYDEAAQLHKEVLKHYAKELGQNHPVTADSWHKMGSIFALQDYSNHDVQESE
jgi:tetratricopeptide (TPR) repeat protein